MTAYQTFNKNIILGQFIRVGDFVVVARDHRNDDGYNEMRWKDVPPDGTVAQCIEFPVRHAYRGYNEGWMNQKPGVYQKFTAPKFLWVLDGKVYTGYLCPHLLKFKDNRFDAETRRGDDFWKLYDKGTYLGPLPELPVMIGDKVSYDALYTNGHYTGEGVVERIEYHYLGKRCDDDSDYSVIGVAEPGRGSSSYKLSQVTLLERGNYYHWYFGNKEDLKFDSLQAEASFYSNLGMSEQLHCPSSGNYGWPIEEAIQAIRECKGDVVKMEGSMFGSSQFTTLYRFIDLPDLSRRLREATIAGFPNF